MSMTRDVAIIVMMVSPLSIKAQTPTAALSINAGSATDVAGVRSSALTLAPSITAVGRSSTTSLSGNFTKFSNQSWSAALGSALSARAGSRTLTPTLDFSATAATTSQSFSYVTAEAIPALELNVGAARLFSGARLGAAGASALTPRAAGAPIVGSTRTSVSRTAATLIGGATLSAQMDDGSSTALTWRGEVGTVAGSRQSENALSASVGSDRVAVGGSIGRRAVGATTSTFGNASVTVAATSAVAIQLAAGKYPANPMIGVPAGQFVNAGIALRFGARTPALPRPSDVAAPGRGMTRLSIRAADARLVEVGGDFNKWITVPARRAPNGVWYVDLAIPPGQYRYAFRVDGKEWRVPAGVAATDDEFGGKTAWLTVTGTAGAPGKH